MKGFPSTLEIRVHQSDGSVERFTQTHPETILDIIDSFELHRLFEQPTLQLESNDGVMLFTTSEVLQVDLITDVEPTWRFPKGNGIAIEITEEEFRRRYQPQMDRTLKRDFGLRAGDKYRGFIVLNLVCGRKVHLYVKAIVRERHEQRVILEDIRSGSTVFFPRAGGGYSFINLTRVLRVDFLPGQPNITPDAWPVESKNEQSEGDPDAPEARKDRSQVSTQDL